MPAPNIGLDQICQARDLLSKYFLPTRLQRAASVSQISGGEVRLKIESELPTGSFKIRGALYALAVNVNRRQIAKVVTASTGNHGAAVAYAATLLGTDCTVFLPKHPNPTKRDRIADLGAKVIELGKDLTEAAAHAARYSQQEHAYFLNDATDEDLPAGPATIACEILDQWCDIDTLVVPIGDTALIRGIASAVRQLRPEIHIVGVQAQNAPAYYYSWAAKHIVQAESRPTIADGLASQIPVPENVDRICQCVDDICLVSDEEMLGAIRHLILRECVLSEPAGSAAVAALIYGKVRKPGMRITAIVSGANISPQVLHAIATVCHS